jgi:hypothetical protein
LRITEESSDPLEQKVGLNDMVDDLLDVAATNAVSRNFASRTICVREEVRVCGKGGTERKDSRSAMLGFTLKGLVTVMLAFRYERGARFASPRKKFGAGGRI